MELASFSLLSFIWEPGNPKNAVDGKNPSQGKNVFSSGSVKFRKLCISYLSVRKTFLIFEISFFSRSISVANSDAPPVKKMYWTDWLKEHQFYQVYGTL